MLTLIRALLLLLCLPVMLTSYASNGDSIPVSECASRIDNPHPFILVLSRDQNIIGSILACANAAALPGAGISGLGAIEDPVLGFYGLSKHRFTQKQFPGAFEILALTGNITALNGKRYAHLHIELGNKQYKAVGGHLVDARVGATAEILILPLNKIPTRTFNEAVGLNLINPHYLGTKSVTLGVHHNGL